MRLNFDDESRLKADRFSRLGLWYILALSAVATVAIIGQVVIQLHLRDQLSDSAVVNVAGRQRMLSQKIAKLALIVNNTSDPNSRDSLLSELQTATALWSSSHYGLQHGSDSLSLPAQNSDSIKGLFNRLTPAFQQILGHTNALIVEQRS